MCENAQAAGIGTPDVVKATCPVWGALGGIPLPQDSMDAVLRLHLITALFSEVDEQLRALPKHPEAHLWPSEVVTLGLLHALKGVAIGPFIAG